MRRWRSPFCGRRNSWCGCCRCGRRWGARLERVRRRFRAIAERLGLDDPIVLAQGLATIGVVTLVLVTWRFRALIMAWASTVSTAEPQRLWPLGPDNEDEKVLYRAILTVLFLAFTAGVLRVIHLRKRQGTRGAPSGSRRSPQSPPCSCCSTKCPIASSSRTRRCASPTTACAVMSSARIRSACCCIVRTPSRTATSSSRETIRRCGRRVDGKYLYAAWRADAMTRTRVLLMVDRPPVGPVRRMPQEASGAGSRN